MHVSAHNNNYLLEITKVPKIMLLVSYMTRTILIMANNTEYYYPYHCHELVLNIVMSRKNCETNLPAF